MSGPTVASRSIGTCAAGACESSIGDKESKWDIQGDRKLRVRRTASRSHRRSSWPPVPRSKA